MALTIDALKGLYEELGGTDFGNVSTIPEAIDKVAEVATGGGGGDDAKPLIVHGTADPVSTKTAVITDEISLADIYNAAAAGRYVAFECPLDEGNTTRIPLAGYTMSDGEYELAFRVATEDIFTGTKPAVLAVDFENSTTGTANIIASE